MIRIYNPRFECEGLRYIYFYGGTIRAKLHSLDSQILENFISKLAMGQTISHLLTNDRSGVTFGSAQVVIILCLGKDTLRHPPPSSSQLNTATSLRGSEGMASRVLRGEFSMDVDRSILTQTSS